MPAGKQLRTHILLPFIYRGGHCMNTIYDNQTLDRASVLLMQGLVQKITPLITDIPADSDADRRWELMRRTQQLAVEARMLYSRCECESDHDAVRAKLLELGYSCERIGPVVRIELPLLLPKRGGDVSFITEPLHELLSLDRDAPRFRDCTVVFRNIYNGEKKAADVRDHDNVETRAVLNVLERFLLVSDSGYYCTNVQMTEFGRASKTVITILPGKLDIHQIRKAVTG